MYRRRTVFDNGQAVETPRYQREKLLALGLDRRAGADHPAQFNHGGAAGLHGLGPALRRHADHQECGAQRASEGGLRSDHSPDYRVALHSIAEQMGNVLYRMSYSSIIRESQTWARASSTAITTHHCRSDSTMHRLAARLSPRHREDGAARCMEAGRLRDPQPSLLRAPVIRRTSASSAAGVLRWRTRRLPPPTPRTTSTSARRRPAS